MKTARSIIGLGVGPLGIAASLLVVTCASAAEPRPVVKTELLSGEVFVGEDPVVAVTVTAATDESALVVDPNLAHLRPDVWIDLLKHGSRVPGGLPYAWRRGVPLPERFRRLPPGQSVVLRFHALSRPDEPGDYVLRAEFTLTPDEAWTIKKDFPLRCVEISAKSIKDKLTLVVPVGPREKERVEVMNVMTGKAHDLIFRTSSLDGTAPRLYRICPLDEDSRLTAVAKRFEDRQRVQHNELWVAFNRALQLHFTRIDLVTGSLLEDRILVEEGRTHQRKEATDTKERPP